MTRLLLPPRHVWTKAGSQVGFWPPCGPEGKTAVLAVADPSFVEDPAFGAVMWFLQHPTSKTSHMGWSVCRVCGCPNGSDDYHRDGFTWPSGYDHYVVMHDVVPPPEFIAAAVMAYRRGVK